MGKRGNGEGSITCRKDGLYMARYTVETATGAKRKTLKPSDVQRFYRVKLDSGLSSATVHKLHVVLHKALKQALRWGLVARNVSDDVDAPKVYKEELTPLTSEQARKFLRNGTREPFRSSLRRSFAIRSTSRRIAGATLGRRRPRSPHAAGAPRGHEGRR